MTARTVEHVATLAMHLKHVVIATASLWMTIAEDAVFCVPPGGKGTSVARMTMAIMNAWIAGRILAIADAATHNVGSSHRHFTL